MPHELKTSPDAIELSVSAPSRERLFRDALTGVLEAAYGASVPAGVYAGRVVPVQASAGEDDALLAELVHDVLRAVRDEPGTLRAPRWLAFDEKRVTATLPVELPRADGLPIEVSRAEVEAAEGTWRARVELIPVPVG